MNISVFLTISAGRLGKVTNGLASSGAFAPLILATYPGMRLKSSVQIRSKAATPTATKF